MFEYFHEFLGRLKVHSEHKITDPVKKVIIEFLAQLLSIIGLTTKLITEGRFSEPPSSFFMDSSTKSVPRTVLKVFREGK